MARLEADAAGKIVRFLTADQEAMGNHPALSGSPLLVDELSNAALVADLQKSTDPYTLVAGVLKKGAATQAIAGDSPSTSDAKNVKANAPAIFAALRAGTATNAQVQRVLAFLLRQYLQG